MKEKEDMDNFNTKDNLDSQATNPKAKIGATIAHAMRHTWKNFGAMLLLFLVYSALTSVSSYLINMGLGSPMSIFLNVSDMGNDSQEANMFFLLAGVILFLMVVLLITAIFKGFITTDDEENVSLKDFFVLDKKVFAGFFTSIVTSIVHSIPVVAFFFQYMTMVIPLGDTTMSILAIATIVITFILSFYLFYAPFYSLEDGVGPFTAMGRSFSDVSKNPLYILGLFISVMLIVFFGSLLVIPIIFLVPMSMVVSANSYRSISRYRTDNIVKDIDRMFSPTVEHSDTGAERDMKAVLGEGKRDTI